MSDFVYHERLKKIFERCGGKNFKSEGIEVVRDRKKNFISVFTSDLIDIPSEFRAYIHSDTACHGLGGSYVNLRIDYASIDDIFFGSESNDSQCFWFDSDGYCIPNGDIAFATIQPYLHPRPCSPSDAIPPMPTLEELQKCSIRYEGRKTILTYCDGFVGEAICHADDEFNVNTGVAYAYTRAKKAKEGYDTEQEKKKKVKIGDVVKVIDVGKNYQMWDTLVVEICQKISNLSACSRFAYNEFLGDSKDKFSHFKVLYIDDNFAYIESLKTNRCHLIGIDGIKKVLDTKQSEEDEDELWF